MNDVELVIGELSDGIPFDVDMSASYDEAEPFLEEFGAYNVEFIYSYDNFVLENFYLNGIKTDKGDIMTAAPEDDSKNFGISVDGISENGIAVSRKKANELMLSLGDTVGYSLYVNGHETLFTVESIIEHFENAPDILIKREGIEQVLRDNQFSDSCNLSFCIADYDTCRRLIYKAADSGYSASSNLYDMIYQQVNTIYITFSGLITMSIVLAAAMVMVFVSFFMIILVKRKALIALLIHSGMRLRRIVFFYWLIIESDHILISLISIPVSMKMIKWIKGEYTSTFELQCSDAYLDVNSI